MRWWFLLVLGCSAERAAGTDARPPGSPSGDGPQPGTVVFQEDFEGGIADIEQNWSATNTALATRSSETRPVSAGAASLRMGWVKLQNYDATPDGWFDDLVVATARVGC